MCHGASRSLFPAPYLVLIVALVLNRAGLAAVGRPSLPAPDVPLGRCFSQRADEFCWPARRRDGSLDHPVLARFGCHWSTFLFWLPITSSQGRLAWLPRMVWPEPRPALRGIMTLFAASGMPVSWQPRALETHDSFWKQGGSRGNFCSGLFASMTLATVWKKWGHFGGLSSRPDGTGFFASLFARTCMFFGGGQASFLRCGVLPKSLHSPDFLALSTRGS